MDWIIWAVVVWIAGIPLTLLIAGAMGIHEYRRAPGAALAWPLLLPLIALLAVGDKAIGGTRRVYDLGVKLQRKYRPRAGGSDE